MAQRRRGEAGVEGGETGLGLEGLGRAVALPEQPILAWVSRVHCSGTAAQCSGADDPGSGEQGGGKEQEEGAQRDNDFTAEVGHGQVWSSLDTLCLISVTQRD